MKAYDLVLLSLKMILFFMGVAHGDPIFAQVGPKIVIFRGFSSFFRTTGFQSKLLTLIKSPIIFHWKPAKKIEVGVVLGQNLGQIRSNVVKK